jgi:hypothetical protein
LEEALRKDVANYSKLTPQNASRKELQRVQPSASKSVPEPWHLTGESRSLTKQLKDKIRVMGILQDAVEAGGEIVIDIPKPEKPAAKETRACQSGPKSKKGSQLTSAAFEKLKASNAELKKDKATLAAKNTLLMTIMDANGLQVDHLADTSGVKRFSTPKSGRSEGTTSSQYTQEAKLAAQQLEEKTKEADALSKELEDIKVQLIESKMKMVKYKSQRKMLSKFANHELTDSE